MTIDDAAAIALALPEVSEGERRGTRTWLVGKKAFAWERPLNKADIKRFGNTTPPDGPILAVRVADLDDKEALLATAQPGLFTIPHFDGYAAVLIQLDAVDEPTVRDAIADAWFACAPPKLADEHPEL